MLENKILLMTDRIDGEDVKLAIDEALELSLARDPRDEMVDVDKLFSVSGEELVYGSVPVNECALPSILEAYKMGGKAFKEPKTTDAILSHVFTEMRHMVAPNAKVLFADGQVIGIRSERYKMVPLHQVLDEIIPSMSAYYDEYMHTEVEMSYAESYIKFLTDKKFTFNSKEKPLTVTLKNSENGEASIGINAYIGRTNMLPIMKGIHIIHTKNRATIEELRSCIGSLENVIEQAFDKLKELEKIEIDKPYAAIDELQKKYKLGLGYCDNVKEKMKSTNTIKCKAADIYEMLADEMLTGTGISRETLEGYQNDLLKLISFDWSKYEKEELPF